MTSFVRVSFAIVFAGVAAVAAGAAQSGNQQHITIPASANAGCPVAMKAEHSPGLGAPVLAGKGGSVFPAPYREKGQQLQLTLSNPGTSAVSAIRITVHGWNGTGRALPAQSAAQESANAERTVDVQFNVDAGQTVNVPVWVSGLSAVNLIDLVGVSYSDGSNWKPTAQQACSVVPDPLMLITKR